MVRLYGQHPHPSYRYVPFRMLERTFEPSALVWKAMVRLPFGVKNRLALALSGRLFYPAETDYCFPEAETEGSDALVAVAQ